MWGPGADHPAPRPRILEPLAPSMVRVLGYLGPTFFTTHGDMVMVWGWNMAWGLPDIENSSFYGGDLFLPRHEATCHGISACFSAMDIGYERDIYSAPLGNDGQFGTLIFCKTMGNLNSRLFENCWVSSDCPCYPMLEDYDDYLWLVVWIIFHFSIYWE